MKKSIAFVASLITTINVYATGWTFCDGVGGQPHPVDQWICGIRASSQTGYEGDLIRCFNAQLSYCVSSKDQGIPGFHDVPTYAWFPLGGMTDKFKIVRCRCDY